MNVLKLTDARKAGTSESKKCTLILTEGDSANALALAGLSEVGSKYYGSYPLKGKILNGYNASNDKWSKNAVIQDVIQCLGLKHKKIYNNVNDLRYGSVLIMADQDVDGFHIRGLVFSLFGSHWKELLSIPGFIKVMRTPLVKAYRGKTLLKEFFNEQTAKKYIEGNPNLRFKYYKGLGTSTSKEAKEYFKNLDRYTFPMSGDPCILEKAFNDKDESKKFRREVVVTPPDYTNLPNTDGRTYDLFVKGPWVEAARASNERSIPDLIDGLKPVQRKILDTMINRSNTEIKVAQLGSMVAQKKHYHHGETNVGNAIVNMAQDFVGSNNLPYLVPAGQFGTRHKGGKDAASHRYIFTKLQDWVKLVFREEDLPVLEYNYVDGHKVEPTNFVPIIPTLLLNGIGGIGTGWATDIPAFNPKDVIDSTKTLLSLNAVKYIKPWYNGFKGTLTEDTTSGKYTIQGDTIVVKELPVGMWTETFKDKLKKNEKYIVKYIENHTDTSIEFTIKCKDIKPEDLIVKLRLDNQRIKKNCVVFHENKLINTKIQDIIIKHGEARYKLYEKRKAYQLEQYGLRIVEKENKKKFIKCALVGDIPITTSNYDTCVEKCNELQIDPKYLDIRLRDITTDACEKLNREISELKNKKHELEITSIKDMWGIELGDLERHLYPNNKRKRD